MENRNDKWSKFSISLITMAMLIVLMYMGTFAKGTVISKVSSIKLNKTIANIYVNDTFKLSPVVKTIGKLKYTVKYVSSNKIIAKVDQNGIITGITAGKATITASVNNLKATIVIVVSTKIITPKVVKIEIITPEIINFGEATKVSANVTMNPSTAVPPSINYSVDNTNIATVDHDGNITMVKDGVVTVTATAGNASASRELTIIPRMEEIAISVPITMSAGDTAKVLANVSMKPSTAKVPEIKYITDHTNIATIDNNGNIIALSPGTVNITATSGNVTTSAAVTITPPIQTIHLDTVNYERKTAEQNKSIYNNNLFIANNQDFRILGQKTLVYDCGENATADQNQIAKYKKIVILDDGTIQYSNDMKNLFKDLITIDKNYFAVHISNNQMLVYLKAENSSKLIQNFTKLTDADFYTEQYINFDENIRIKPLQDIIFESKLEVGKFDVTGSQANFKLDSSDHAVATIDENGDIKGKANGNITLSATIHDKRYVFASRIYVPIIDDIQISNENGYTNQFVMMCEKQKLSIKVKNNPNIILKGNSKDNSIASIDEYGNLIGKNQGKTDVEVKVGINTIRIPIIVYNDKTDTDGDGLTDFQEIHKYFTNPEKNDSDGDGILDGDWLERREYTYTICAKEKLYKNYNKTSMNNEYQDIKLIEENDEYMVFEAIYYPYVTYESINFTGNKNWQKENANNPDLQQYLSPGITTNWDEQMKNDLITELKQAGIDPDQLTDSELAVKVGNWVGDKFKFIDDQAFGRVLDFSSGKASMDGFSDYYKKFIYGHAPIYINFEDALNHVVYGKQMYYNKTHAWCTSIATLKVTLYKALGLPTRIRIRTPMGIYNDDTDDTTGLNHVKYMTQKNLLNNLQNRTIGNALMNTTFGDHWYPEVYLGGSWITVDGILFKNHDSDNCINMIIGDFNDVADFNGYKYWSNMQYGNSQFKRPQELLDLSDAYGINSKK